MMSLDISIYVLRDVYLVHKCPKGYPRLAALLSSEENFMIYRKFSYLQARLLLHRQDELRELERDLDDLDENHKQNSPEFLGCREDDDALSGKRKLLLDKISECFQEYCKAHKFPCVCILFPC